MGRKFLSVDKSFNDKEMWNETKNYGILVTSANMLLAEFDQYIYIYRLKNIVYFVFNGKLKIPISSRMPQCRAKWTKVGASGAICGIQMGFWT